MRATIRVSFHRRSVLEAHAREMRRALMPSEQLLFRTIRGKQLGVSFRRQVSGKRFGDNAPDRLPSLTVVPTPGANPNCCNPGWLPNTTRRWPSRSIHHRFHTEESRRNRLTVLRRALGLRTQTECPVFANRARRAWECQPRRAPRFPPAPLSTRLRLSHAFLCACSVAKRVQAHARRCVRFGAFATNQGKPLAMVAHSGACRMLQTAPSEELSRDSPMSMDAFRSYSSRQGKCCRRA